MADEDTTRTHRNVGSLSADERLRRIEESIDKVDEKLDGITGKLNSGETRFTAIDITIASLTHRVESLEGSRDMVVKIIVGAVLITILALIGLKVAA